MILGKVDLHAVSGFQNKVYSLHFSRLSVYSFSNSHEYFCSSAFGNCKVTNECYIKCWKCSHFHGSVICRMAEWVKQQAEREAEKEQRRLERLQRKLAEPKHYFTNPDYQQQCHEMAERLEDSVLKGITV